ncbi:hypothetical protein Ddye_009114 [Dipteronia dyeriana]|uniref:Reverse transcriptase domain-containing protein n=1 Tax=Dipteronia dyeriana TaxID=168575 RepID=A0AAD9XB54_9ROSI|nr:hypothetical protein Ddye_009114 [Dipteronia dyeriana]
MAIKLDMAKAYDWVEWLFLEGMMQKIRFLKKWVSLIIRCIFSVSYSVNINGEAQIRGDISGFRCSRGGPIITHIFFADDILLFTKANEKNCLAIKAILDDYEKASREAVNFGKSAICISPSFNASEGEMMASLLGII